MLRNSLLLLLTLSLVRCSAPENKAAAGEKKLVVNAAYCKKYQVRESYFTAIVPDILVDEGPVEGQVNQAFAYYSLVKPQEGASDSVQTEFISLGPFWNNTGGIAEADLMKNSLSQMIGYFEQVGYKISEQNISKTSFDGKTLWQLRAKATVDNIDMRLKGSYQLLVLVLPPEGASPNGLFIIMGANQQSPIRSFDDFASKGTISRIWKTIQFN